MGALLSISKHQPFPQQLCNQSTAQPAPNIHATFHGSVPMHNHRIFWPYSMHKHRICWPTSRAFFSDSSDHLRPALQLSSICCQASKISTTQDPSRYDHAHTRHDHGVTRNGTHCAMAWNNMYLSAQQATTVPNSKGGPTYHDEWRRPRMTYLTPRRCAAQPATGNPCASSSSPPPYGSLISVEAHTRQDRYFELEP